MKILQTLHWVQFAETEKVCVDLCNEMSKNNEVILLSNKDITAYLSENVKFIEFDFEKNRYNPFFLYKTAKLIKKISPDIIHAHNTKVIEIIHNCKIFLNKKITLIATKHDLRFKKHYKYADLCVAILDDAFKILPKHTILIENGMAYKMPKIIKKIDKFHIISSGRLSPEKGHQDIIKALSNVKFDFLLDIYGRGEYEQELKNLVNELNLNNKVRFCGFSDDIATVLANSDLQIIASHIEPFGLVAIDGIYYSPLLISTNTGICTKILPNELIFENSNLSEKLNEIYENYDKFTEIFSKIKAKKDDFSIEKMTEKYLKAYESLIKEIG
ncbi:glycosyltransferase [Campylobacter sputorum]|uniref:glycosyltransferase n=1 Tax=Campylobacter sputorum TaxID=206 RepID=UPI000B771FCF|nr:glycosyltransferase [Campylobacter sputorum]ASM36786.1 glycosyltransferase, family 1 [Campylobacter sputorum bv. faecalis CCUG 20703]